MNNIFKTASEIITNIKPPVYFGFFLTDEAKSNLLSWWENVVNTPLLDKIYTDHITAVFKPSKEETIELRSLVGNKYPIVVNGYAHDENCQAVSVNNIDGLIRNKTPHITIACAQGTNPVYSNSLLDTNLVKTIGIELETYFDSFPRSI
jgi:hypothetical protein